MDYLGGGDLLAHFNHKKRFNEQKVKFFISQVALALGHLHEKKYIYRDLKLENLLFDKDGYLVLVDFGLASKLDGNNVSKTFVGTNWYLAPEMVLGHGHDETVDWWTLGILTYELIVGKSPFFDKNQK